MLSDPSPVINLYLVIGEDDSRKKTLLATFLFSVIFRIEIYQKTFLCYSHYWENRHFVFRNKYVLTRYFAIFNAYFSAYFAIFKRIFACIFHEFLAHKDPMSAYDFDFCM